MSCSFTVYWTQIPADKVEQVKAKLAELELIPFMKVSEVVGKFYLEETEEEVGFSTATDITDRLFPEVAKILEGTDLDGQIVETECEGDKTYYLLVNGQSKGLDNFVQEFTPATPIPVGTIIEANLKVKIIGLANGQAGILEFLYDKSQKQQG